MVANRIRAIAWAVMLGILVMVGLAAGWPLIAATAAFGLVLALTALVGEISSSSGRASTTVRFTRRPRRG